MLARFSNGSKPKVGSVKASLGEKPSHWPIWWWFAVIIRGGGCLVLTTELDFKFSVPNNLDNIDCFVGNFAQLLNLVWGFCVGISATLKSSCHVHAWWANLRARWGVRVVLVAGTAFKLAAFMFWEYDQIHVWIYVKGVKEIEPYSTKVDDIKIKRDGSLLFSLACSDFKAFWSCEIKVHVAVLVQSLHRVFISPVVFMSRFMWKLFICSHQSVGKLRT